jgi:hypothetical protein
MRARDARLTVPVRKGKPVHYTWLPISFPDDPVPGCGYGPFRTGPADPFFLACEIHDKDYGERLITRNEADAKFIRNMRRIVLSFRGPARLLLWARMYAYIGIVKAAGPLFYLRRRAIASVRDLAERLHHDGRDS